MPKNWCLPNTGALTIITLRVAAFLHPAIFNTSITVLTNQISKLLIALFKVPNTGAFTVIVTWNYILWWQTNKKLLNSLLYNATFDRQIYNFLLKVCVQTLLANKKIKEKPGLHFYFLFLNWKVLSSKTFTVFFNCQKPPALEISWTSGVLANVSYYL